MGEPSSADDTGSTSQPLLSCDEVIGLIEEGHEQGFLSNTQVAAALQDVAGQRPLVGNQSIDYE